MITNDNLNLENEFIIVNKPSSVLPFIYYYPIGDVAGVNDINETKLSIKEKNSFWLLYASEKFSDQKHSIKKYVDSAYNMDDEIEFTGIKLYHYTKID